MCSFHDSALVRHMNVLRSLVPMLVFTFAYFATIPATHTQHIPYTGYHVLFILVCAVPCRWDVYTDDFFPYATNYDGYWVGYFSSRPLVRCYILTYGFCNSAIASLSLFLFHLQLKGLVSASSAVHRLTEQLTVFAQYALPNGFPAQLLTGIGYMRQALAEVCKVVR